MYHEHHRGNGRFYDGGTRGQWSTRGSYRGENFPHSQYEESPYGESHYGQSQYGDRGRFRWSRGTIQRGAGDQGCVRLRDGRTWFDERFGRDRNAEQHRGYGGYQRGFRGGNRGHRRAPQFYDDARHHSTAENRTILIQPSEPPISRKSLEQAVADALASCQSHFDKKLEELKTQVVERDAHIAELVRKFGETKQTSNNDGLSAAPSILEAPMNNSQKTDRDDGTDVVRIEKDLHVAEPGQRENAEKENAKKKKKKEAKQKKKAENGKKGKTASTRLPSRR
ncbi:unnamed protein product [Caenorhabditis sp. 36 PRJEB53466]|nr:unnamed protein product [Caenorhabditis sp. 36 PRJEB53466]